MRNKKPKIILPGAGELASSAAANNQCTATWFSKGYWHCCYANLDIKENQSPDPYLCMGHFRQQEDYKKTMRGE